MRKTRLHVLPIRFLIRDFERDTWRHFWVWNRDNDHAIKHVKKNKMSSPEIILLGNKNQKMYPNIVKYKINGYETYKSPYITRNIVHFTM